MITTKKGDQGETSLYDGTRVRKDDMRIELNGELDELNALLGLCKATTQRAEPFEKIQRELMSVMAIIANGYQHRPDVDALPRAIDVLQESLSQMETCIQEATRGKKFDFVLPGKSLADAALHLARTQTRTCERRLVSLASRETTEGNRHCYAILKKYLNRLSDFLFSLSIE